MADGIVAGGIETAGAGDPNRVIAGRRDIQLHFARVQHLSGVGRPIDAGRQGVAEIARIGLAATEAGTRGVGKGSAGLPGGEVGDAPIVEAADVPEAESEGHGADAAARIGDIDAHDFGIGLAHDGDGAVAVVAGGQGAVKE